MLKISSMLRTALIAMALAIVCVSSAYALDFSYVIDLTSPLYADVTFHTSATPGANFILDNNYEMSPTSYGRLIYAIVESNRGGYDFFLSFDDEFLLKSGDGTTIESVPYSVAVSKTQGAGTDSGSMTDKVYKCTISNTGGAADDAIFSIAFSFPDVDFDSLPSGDYTINVKAEVVATV